MSAVRTIIRVLVGIFAIGTIFSCAAVPRGIDPAFGPQVNSFRAEASARGKYYDLNSLYGIQFVPNYSEYEDGEDIVGMCDMSFRVITISAERWPSFNQAQKEEIIFHEIGHCVMELEHSPCPGVMCEYLSGGWVEPDRTYYLDTFFSSKP